MNRGAAALAAVGVLILAGCGGSEPDVSAECLEAMRAAAGERDPERADPLIAASLDACKTAEEWLAALREHPAAMGLTERATIDDQSHELACYAFPDTAVCRDAAG